MSYISLNDDNHSIRLWTLTFHNLIFQSIFKYMKTILILLLSLIIFAVNSLGQARLPILGAFVVEQEEEYVPNECSFYCANFSVTERASSTLPHRDKLRYDARQVQDHNLKTAWVEGSEGDGVGEFLEYIIDTSEHKGDDPLKVTSLGIYNGYRKSRESWRDNSRVKRLKMYVNGSRTP